MGISERIRAAVVGVGYLGRFHAEKYADMTDAELVGVVDTNREQALQVARKTGASAYSDYTELFGKVDAVSIAVPTPFHYEIARAFLDAGVDVL
ncbi:MAG: Gfo/Idh/MocA family protein, partial [Desulfosalsimonas sp.]